jgi:8-hydroxy-5-deazaflavin:NADPH oxidoreductase
MTRIALRAGRQVAIANTRGPESPAQLVQELGGGVSAGTVEDAAAAGIVVVAVMWSDVPQAVERLEWGGRIVIDPANDFDPTDLDGRTSSEIVADLVAPARVVKAGDTFGAAVLGSDPHQGGGQRVILCPVTTLRPSLRSWRCSRTPASLPLTSSAWARAARCSRSVVR